MVKLAGKRGTFGLWTEQFKSLGGWNSILIQSCEILCKKHHCCNCVLQKNHIYYFNNIIWFSIFFRRSVHIKCLKFYLGLFCHLQLDRKYFCIVFQNITNFFSFFYLTLMTHSNFLKHNFPLWNINYQKTYSANIFYQKSKNLKKIAEGLAKDPIYASRIFNSIFPYIEI